jgi:hypothetical protein
MLQTLMTLGLSVLAGILNAAARGSYNEAVQRHGQTVTVCQERIRKFSEQSQEKLTFAAAKQTYIEAIRVANAVWRFLDQERRNLRELEKGMASLRHEMINAVHSRRHEMGQALQTLQKTHQVVAINYGELRGKVQVLNQRTAGLREQFQIMGPAGVTYYEQLQQRKEAKLLGQ